MGVWGRDRNFGNVLLETDADDLRGPDGFAFDAGKLYVATYGQGDVTVLDHDGSVLQRISTPRQAAHQRLFRTARREEDLRDRV
jgi:sugar lactone lactonase YvrE